MNSILSDPSTAAEFAVRAITRDSTKPKAVALAKMGAEVVMVSTYIHTYSTTWEGDIGVIQRGDIGVIQEGANGF